MHYRIASALDRLVAVGLLGLAALTPLVLGAVHPWAYALAEAVIFALAASAMGKLAVNSGQGAAILPGELPYILVPAGLFAALVGFQRLPIPPELLHYLSPATYHLYAACLRDWPAAVPYAELIGLRPAVAPTWSTAWRTVSVVPAFTAVTLLKLLAYTALLLMVGFYPFGSIEAGAAGRRFIRLCVCAVACIAIAYAALGVVENLDWNGRILWCIVPRDWNGPQPNLQRALGPFVDPDHFGTYLVMTYPLLLAGILAPRSMVAESYAPALRAFFGLGLLLVLVALSLTMSRASWLAAGVGAMVMAGIGVTPGTSRGQRNRRFLLVAAGALVALLLVLFIVSGQQQTAADQRLDPSALGVTLAGRIQVWKASLRMWRSFPVFGVGLGAWQEIFPHFQLPPRPLGLFHEAHNDYLQILAETGALGFLLCGWFGWRILRVLRQGWRAPSQSMHVLFAGLMAGIAGAAVQETFDFGLQIPANAILFAILLGVAVRIAVAGWRRDAMRIERRGPVAIPVLFGVLALGLTAAALAQSKRGDADPAALPATPAQTWRELMAHPAMARAHLALLNLSGFSLPAAQQLRELSLASWLDPDDPYLRDRYALALIESGAARKGLAELSDSIYVAPQMESHFYLSAAGIKHLSAADQLAIANGFSRAVMAGVPGAIEGMDAFYTALGRFADLATFYAQLAGGAGDDDQRAAYLVAAGDAYEKAGQLARAAAALNAAAQIDGSDSRIWLGLAAVALQGNQPAAALKLADQGVAQGADPGDLYWGLYQQASAHKNLPLAGQALRKFTAYRPYDFDGLIALGNWSLENHDFPRAAANFERASEVDPNSPYALYRLGVAQERDYNYQAAEDAYKRALQVAPHDGQARYYYDQFEHKLKTLSAKTY